MNFEIKFMMKIFNILTILIGKPSYIFSLEICQYKNAKEIYEGIFNTGFFVCPKV
jgi:hypothetical protein